MSEQRPFVSIVMPCYNASAQLADSVGSVLRQSLSNWELIAIDDGSTDDTLNQLRSFSDPRIHIISQSNAGVSRARNRALREAHGRFIAFLDADDTWEPEFLAHMTAALEANPKAILAYCGWQNIGLPGGRGDPFIPPDYESPNKTETLLGGCRWPIHAALVRSDVIHACNGFPEQYSNAEDFRLWLELATAGQIVRVPEVLAKYHFHGGAQASKARARAIIQTLKVKQDFVTAHPDRVAALGRQRLHQLTIKMMRDSAITALWQRDLDTAQTLLRALPISGLSGLTDLKYLLPAWLPRPLYRGLYALADRARTASKAN